MHSEIVPSLQSGTLLTRLSRGLAKLDFSTPRASYVLRAILAAWLALVLAYLLELDMPFSAASTVLLVINPVQGAVIGKGAWRFIGTLAGMAVALFLMSAFAQAPWLFLAGFGLWLGLCVAAMTLLRHFRASGAVVAGYTVGLATFGALQHPQLAFEHVIGRGSTVLLGVVCLGLVSALFSRRSVRGKLEALLARLAAACADAIAEQHPAGPSPLPDRVAPARRSLMADLYGVDDLLALGKAESADLAHRAAAVRHAMASLFAAVVGGAPPLPPHGASAQALAALWPLLQDAWRAAGQALARHRPDQAREVLLQARARLLAALTGEDAAFADHVAARIRADRLLEQIDDYVAALDGMAVLQRPRPLTRWPQPRFHRDMTAALQNGLRAMLTLVAAGAFWFLTGWPQGDMLLLVVAPYCALLATAGNPAAAAAEFFKGTVVAVPMAFICAFAVLPHLQGLPLLLLVLGLFWLPGIYATTMPKYGLAGLAYLVGFNTLAAASNPMHYDLALFLNWSLAWILATLFTLLGFRLILPRHVPRDIERLRRRIRAEALAVLGGRQADRRHWQSAQQHRMAQLGAALKARPETMDQAIGDALASLHLGREVLGLQAWLRRGASPLWEPVNAVLQRMARRCDRPVLAARHARRAARQLSSSRAGLPGERRRLEAALIDIADLLEDHAAYFSPLSTRRSHAQ